MGINHYENFPVASILVPRRLRTAVGEIYRFARHADDLADEGEAPTDARLAALAALRGDLDRIEAGSYPSGQVWSALAEAVRRHRLPVERLRELLHAFEQDVRGMVYGNYEDLLGYCRFSANPVGRLLLALYERDEAPLRRWSDAVCTGLQLVNFCQDVDRDHAKGRIYIPQSEFARFGVDPGQIAQRRINEAWTHMIRAQTQIAREHLTEGGPLASALGGRIGWELRLVIQGGLRIAERIDAVQGDVFYRRPVLRLADWARLCARAVVAG